VGAAGGEFVEVRPVTIGARFGTAERARRLVRRARGWLVEVRSIDIVRKRWYVLRRDEAFFLQ